MPHKRQKRSVRLDTQKAIGYNNPPTAADSLLPIQSTSKDGSEAVTEVAAAPKKNNKRRKRAASTGGNGLAGQQDYAGVSKSAFRVLNAVKLREEYHAQKKRRAEEEAQAGKAGNKPAQPALTPLPHESLSSFNRRVEQAMRGSVRAAIKESSLTGQKKKERKVKAKKAEEEGEGEGEDEIAEEDARPVKRGRDGKPLLKKGTAATPEESVDPFAKRKKKATTATASDDDQDAPRNRSGKTEFATVSQRRRVDDVVQAPPTLADPARKGLMAKVLGPGGAAACGVPSAVAGSGSFRLAGAETPVGSSRLPINPAMKAMMDAERERAIKMYRELKEKREQERAPRQQ
ncbi:hypothetical protein C6P46_006104 [Rhodotorula mucilaginosa]|uniref:Uncharacterized protein n=1 Tax=Rhodotorula mucilaginosa TaxID=5537 RepID=A0A9P6VZH0_RHOMI|nr:hypothetical protein C6P46_006104 [Rhodotorula mucilaginosa]TKA54296.1 hypothetical protein B0A53_03388 [Rhodotorula sp. CCFEE 5036]